MRIFRLLVFLMTVAPALALGALPPMPDDLKPTEWKPEPLLRNLFTEFEDLERPEQARAHVAKVKDALEKHPDWVDLQRHYIGVMRILDQWTEAKDKYHTDLAQDSTNADLQYLCGLFERSDEAMPYFRGALEREPNHYHAKCGLGLALASASSPKPEEGLALLFDAARSRPDHPYAYQSIALAYEIAKEWESAIRARELCRIVEPGSFQPIAYESRDLQQAGRDADALLLIEEFSRAHPENRDALRGLVQTYGRVGRPEDASRTQALLAEIAKEGGEESYKAAALMARAGNNEEALKWLLKAGERGYDNYRQARTDPDIASLKDDPSFAKAIERMRKARTDKLPQERARVLAEMIDTPAPEFTVATLDSATLSLAGLRGKIVVLDFWATWCGPCRLTLPLVRDLHAAIKDRPVQIICMNVWERDRDRAKVAPYWKENGYPMTVGLASNEDATAYGVSGIPTLFVIDGEGRIRYRHVGYTAFMDEEVGWVIDSVRSEKGQGALEDR